MMYQYPLPVNVYNTIIYSITSYCVVRVAKQYVLDSRNQYIYRHYSYVKTEATYLVFLLFSF